MENVSIKAGHGGPRSITSRIKEVPQGSDLGGSSSKPTEVSTHKWGQPCTPSTRLGPLRRKPPGLKPRPPADEHSSASSNPPCFLLFFSLIPIPHSHHPPPSTGNPPNVHLFVYTCFCKRCVVSCVNVFVASVHGTVPSVYFSHSSVLKVRVTCCLWLERASYAPWCQPLTLPCTFSQWWTFLHPPPTPATSTTTTLSPQPKWVSILPCVSSWTQVRILLGTLTQTWDVWIGEHVLPSFRELCQEALHWSLCLCQHLSLPTFANLMAANWYWIGALVLCFSDASLEQLFTGLVNWVCFYRLFLTFCLFFSLGLSIDYCIFLVYSWQWILCWF